MRVALLFNFGVGFCFQCCQCFSEQHQKHWIFLLSATHDLTRCTLSTSTPFSHLFFVILSQINILWRCVFVSVTLLHYMLPSSVSFFNLCIDCKPLCLLKKMFWQCSAFLCLCQTGRVPLRTHLWQCSFESPGGLHWESVACLQRV